MKSRKSLYHRRRFPREIIRHTVWLYYRFCLSNRDVEDLLAERGITVSYETVRRWCLRFGPVYANRLRKRSGPAELSHEPTRQRERRMRHFKSIGHAHDVPLKTAQSLFLGSYIVNVTVPAKPLVSGHIQKSLRIPLRNQKQCARSARGRPAALLPLL